MGKYQKAATYNKLVRDKIPKIIEENDDVKVVTRALSQQELADELKKKIIEEVNEFNAAESKEDMIVELADIREIEISLMKELRIDEEIVEKVRLERRKKRGGFDEGVYLIETREKN